MQSGIKTIITMDNVDCIYPTIESSVIDESFVDETRVWC